MRMSNVTNSGQSRLAALARLASDWKRARFGWVQQREITARDLFLLRGGIDLVPPASEWHCVTCGTAKVGIGADLTEELDYIPALFVMGKYVRPTHACMACQQDVVQAALPARTHSQGARKLPPRGAPAAQPDEPKHQQ